MNARTPTNMKMTTAKLAAMALLATAAGATIAAARHCAPAPREDDEYLRTGIASTERGGYRYEFHAPSGEELLFDLRRDPRCAVDVARAHSDILLACREEVLAMRGVRSLEELRAPYAETIRRLEAMGYL